MGGLQLLGLRIASPFVLRTVTPAPQELVGRTLRGVRRIGKRLVLAFEGELFAALHLMIAGRLRWLPPDQKVPGKLGLLAFDFAPGTLLLTEAGSKKRASLHLLAGEAALSTLERGGLEPMGSTFAQFDAALRRENHTLKRALTDPRLFAAIGNAYSDEILHRARLSPAALSQKLSEESARRLHQATLEVLGEWTQRLREEAAASGWPEKVTAFRAQMAVHGRYKLPCPVCVTAVQRIAYADNETDYCPRCQTGGKLLSDRGLARLLREDWPRTIAELEERMPARAAPRK